MTSNNPLSPRQTLSDEQLSERESGRDEHVIPLIAEQLEVGKRTVTTGEVRLHKHTEERTERVDVPLERVQWQVEHVPVGRVVAEVPAIRYEGDVTIYPVIEERLIVTREILLKEEVRVTRSAFTTHEQQTHVLKREAITEDRGDGAAMGGAPGTAAAKAAEPARGTRAALFSGEEERERGDVDRTSGR